MTYTINGIPFPDASTAATYYHAAQDADDYPGFSESIALLRYHNPELSDDDITTLAEAVHQHAHRPHQDVPSRDAIRRMVKGAGILTKPDRPAWDKAGDSFTSLPPALQPTPPTGLITRLARRMARK